MRYALFLGCFIPVRLPHLEAVTRATLPSFGVDLVDVDGFTCCPEPVGFLTDRMTALSIAARNLALAEEQGLDVLTICNGCTYTLRTANAALKSDESLRVRVNEVIAETGHQYRGTIDVRHYAHVLSQSVGIEAIKARVKKPLTGLRVACHPGCHIISPPGVMDFDDNLNPTVLDGLVSALGAEPVDWDVKTGCCGWTLTNYGEKEGANRLLGSKLAAMRGARADCSAVICPQCFYQFDTGQMLAARDLKLDYRVPTIYYLQLLALAMGQGIDASGIRQHRVKDLAFEDKLGRLVA